MKACVKKIILFLLAFMVFTLVPTKAETKTVKVGFFSFDGYHNITNGKKAGYGYDFLQEIAKYTNWRYEYVGYDKSWAEIKQMLIDGDIDILTSAQMNTKFEKDNTEYYLKDYAKYSKNEIGKSATMLTTYKNNVDLITKNYQDYDIKVGAIKGNSRNDSFISWANANDVTYSMELYDTTIEMNSALSNREIDAIVSSNLRKTNNEVILCEFDYTPFYAVVNDDTLLNEVNSAIEKLYADNPNISEELIKKNYRINNNEGIVLTKEEKEFISNNKDTSFKAYINYNMKPLTYEESEKYEGIIPEIFNQINAFTGLNFKLETTKVASYTENMIIVDGLDDYNSAENNKARKTKAYLTLDMTKVSCGNNSGNRVAVIKDTYSELIASENYKVCDNVETAIKYVLNGTVDSIFTDKYTAEYIINTDSTNKLSYDILESQSLKLAIYVSDEADPLLLSILNKSIDAISEDDVNLIIKNELSKYIVKKDLAYYMYNNPEIFLAISLATFVVLVLVIGTIVSYIVFRKEKNLNLQNARYEEILSGVYDEILELNLTDDVKYSIIMNQKRMDRFIVGHATYKKEDMKDSFFAEDIEMAYEKLCNENLKKIANDKSLTSFDCRLITLNQSIKWYTFIMQGVRQADNKLTVMIYKKDINLQKQEEIMKKETILNALSTAREAEKIKTRFLSTVSHELRTPLNAIIGYLELMKKNDDIHKIHDYVKKSDVSTRQLLNIISDVLDLDAIETGKLSIKNEPFNIEELIKGVVSVFNDQANSKGLKFNLVMKDNFYEELIGDELRIRQILYNILSNAIKYTNKGHVDLTVSKRIMQDNKTYVRFVVSDTGIGMSKETIDSLYEPFERGKTNNATGTGLGMPVTKSIITTLQGSINVSSTENEGSTFIIDIPLEKGQTYKYDIAKYQVLKGIIIEQNQAEIDYLSILLKNVGCIFEVISDEKEIYNAKADFYLIGENVFNRDVNEIISLLETNKAAKYIVVTSMISKKKSLLVDEYLEKPIFQSTLNKALERLFGNKNEDNNMQIDYSGLKVLIVEDNIMNSEIAVEIMRKINFTTEVAYDGVMAIEKVNDDKYDLILMDIRMPHMDGLEATRQIKMLENGRDVPIVGMSANAYPSDVSAGLSVGMCDYVSKPINIDFLYKVINKLFTKPFEK